MIPFLFILVMYSLSLFFLCQPNLRFVNFVLFKDPAFGFVYFLHCFSGLYFISALIFIIFLLLWFLQCANLISNLNPLQQCLVLWLGIFPDSPFISFRTQFLWTPLLTIQSKVAYSYFLSQHHFSSQLLSLYDIFIFQLSKQKSVRMLKSKTIAILPLNILTSKSQTIKLKN